MDDAEKLAELCNNQRIAKNLRDIFPHPYTRNDAEVFIQSCLEQQPTTNFAIEYKNELAGCIGLMILSDIYRFGAELGYWVGEPFWNKGIASKAVRLMVDFGFTQLKLIRIFAGIFDYNIASQRVLEKNGFQLECIAEKSIIKDGKLFNEYRYFKINPEYRSVLSS
jgi:RimJ/RimL family protein N-acetyltransferase